MEQVFELVLAFFNDARVGAILALIVLDFLLGVAQALKNNEFGWKRVANFYQTNVIPYILGYLAFYIATKLVTDPAEVLGDYAHLIGEGALTIAWAAILASLGGSIVANLKKLGLGASA